MNSFKFKQRDPARSDQPASTWQTPFGIRAAVCRRCGAQVLQMTANYCTQCGISLVSRDGGDRKEDGVQRNGPGGKGSVPIE